MGKVIGEIKMNFGFYYRIHGENISSGSVPTSRLQLILLKPAQV